MADTQLRLYFENPVGRLLEPSEEDHIIVKYHAGGRRLADLQAFLTHAGQLLIRRNSHKLLGDQRLMAPFSSEESKWITEFWLTAAQRRTDVLYGAVLLPQDVFARLSVTQVISDAKAAAMTYRLFEDEAAAAVWLRQLP
jgi:hypothetical protein